MAIAKWRQKQLKEQPIKLLEYNLKIGKMDKETRAFIKKVISSKKKKRKK